jgi:hypothetical protein
MPAITFKPKQVSKQLLATLPKRARDVVESRYGLGKDTKKKTLESIGKLYGITRERVRQIEDYAIQTIRKSDAFKAMTAYFDELESVIEAMGGVVSEEELLGNLSKDASTQNHLHLLLVLGDAFVKHKEDEHFKHRWHVDSALAASIHESLKKLYKGLSDDELLSEADLIERFLEHLSDVNEQYKNDEVLRRWLTLSKKIGKNPLGEWGKANSANINVKGIRDYAYLIIRRHGSPIHFREVAQAIAKTFGKRAHVATTHNELIKDPRFVLVGRGLYALSEWGYSTGVVKDVIKRILEKSGPLTKQEIVDRVLKERYVKENTILVNLQDASTFKREADGSYALLK